MADGRFFARAAPLRLSEVATAAGAEIADGADPDRLFEDVAPLATAGPADVTFLDNQAYARDLPTSQAGACILRRELAAAVPEGMAALISAAPYRSFAHVARAFHPLPPPAARQHPSAAIDPTARLGADVAIEAHAVIGAEVEIGARGSIGAGAVIGPGVRIGDDCRIGAQSTLEVCLLGDRVRVLPGARIGQRGFGFDTSAFPYEDVPQLGRVLIEDDVEIGANTTIDRGSAADTVIGAGSRLDNLVQIGHNVRLGRGCVVVAQVGIAGSTVLEDFVVVAGQAGLAGHLRVGEGARIGAHAGVMRDVAAGERVAGYPAMPVKEFFRLVAMGRRALKKKD